MQTEPQTHFTIALSTEEAAIINDALRTQANHYRRLRAKACECHMDRAELRFYRQANLAAQVADRVCIAHANAQEAALDEQLSFPQFDDSVPF